MENIKNELVVRKQEIQSYVMVWGAFILLGLVINIIFIYLFENPEDAGSFAGMFSFMGIVINILALGIASMMRNFKIKVGFGVSRKKFLVEEFVFCGISTMVMLLASGVVLWLEPFLVQGLSGQKVIIDTEISAFYSNYLLICVIVFFAAIFVRIAIGAVIMRFPGSVGFIYVLGWLLCVGLVRLAELAVPVIENNTYGIPVLIGIAAIVWLVGIVSGVNSIRKQGVML